MKAKLSLTGAALMAIGGGASAQSSVTIYGQLDVFAGRMAALSGASAQAKPIALAIVRREAANGQQVTVGDGGVTAELVELPFPT